LTWHEIGKVTEVTSEKLALGVVDLVAICEDLECSRDVTELRS
jgi:hypothetical protein